MAEALALTRLGKICDIVREGIGDCLVAPIKRQFIYMCCFNSNITELETQLKDLETTRQGVQMGVNENHRKARVIGRTVVAWLTSAYEVMTEAEGIIQDKDKVKEGCFNGWCPNLKLRYSLSRKAVKKTKVVVDLKADGVRYTQLSYSPPPACWETITNRDFTGFESRRLIMEEIIKALKHDEINLIGVCGMGGVGKTTLVNEVARRAKEDNHFDDVAIAVVSQEPNLTNVQACIAEMLGLKNLLDTESLVVRADLLRRRLLQDNKKVLVILDDIWAEFDLKAMGIPLEGVDKNFKVLYTSRTRDLWHDLRTKKEIPLEILSKDEAWQLFREKAGNSADAPDLWPIAKQIVDECGCLPLALVLIGSALSKKSGRKAIKEIWKGMLDRLTCATSTPVDECLYPRLELSYECLEDEEAKRLFLLCCLFQEDEDIIIEDLARYGSGLSLFDGINKMEKVRRQVFLIVDDLKSRYLLLDSGEEEKECVKVHDVVRDMGISIASKNKFALIIHGEVSEWPKKDTYKHYTCISLISRKITELPRGLTCPNLEFLLLDCRKLKELPCQFFEGMGKLKVLLLKNFEGILALPSSLRNLHTLSLQSFNGKLDNVSEFGELFNLKILSFRDSLMEELPKAIGELVNLRLLDLTNITSLERIPPSVISRLVCLEELYVLSNFKDWEGEGKEEEGRNANLRELGFLSNLNTLEIAIRSDVLIPKIPIFSKLKIYKVIIVQDEELEDEENLLVKCKRVFMVRSSSIPIPSNRGGIESLLRSSDCLFLEGKGCNDLVQALLRRDGVDGLQQLKLLRIGRCDTPECLANTRNPVHLPITHAPAIFPILEVLDLLGLVNLREICSGPVPAHSFGELTFIRVQNCGRLRNLFQLPIVGCLPQLKRLIISSCGMMEEVFWKDQQEDVHAASNRIEFPKLEVLKLEKLPSLMRFCRGIDQIDFPQLKELCLEDIPQANLLFHNGCNLSFNSKRNDNFGFLSLFPEKVSLPNLEVLYVVNLENLERLGHRPLSVGSLSKLKEFSVRRCGKLLCVIPSQFLPMLRELQKLTVESCDSLEVVFELEGLDSNEPSPEILSPLKFVKLCALPKLNCISKRDPACFRYILTLEIHDCNCLGYVFAPTMTKSIPQLRELKVLNCEMLSRIVAEENGLGESSVDEVEFPQLERLELLDLPNLVTFFPNVNVNVNTTILAKSTDHYHNPMQPQPLFNEKVAIPSLEYLGLNGLQNVSDLWGSELPTNSFSKLKTLNVRGFANLRNILCISWFGDLNNTQQGLQEVILPVLEVLEVDRLGNIVEIWDKQSPSVNENTVSCGKLRDVKVQRCEKLTNLVPSNILPQLQNLQKLCVEGCPKIESVFFKNEKEGAAADDSTMIIPQLQYLRISDMENLKSFYSSSTTSNAQSLFNHQVILPVLEVFEVDRLGNILEIWDKQSPWLNQNTVSSFKLRDMKVQQCKTLMNLVPSNILPRLQHLQNLCVEGCPNIESIFFENEKEEVADDSALIIPQLQYLRISDMENLKSFYSSSTASNAQSLFNHQVILPVLEVFEVDRLGNIVEIWDKQSPWLDKNIVSSFKLRYMKVQQCKTLMNLVPSNILPQLQNLQKLFVEGCPTIESIVFKNGKEEEAADHSSLIIPQLWYLRISDMENLKTFYSSSTASNAQSLFNHQVSLPNLEVLHVSDLENLERLGLGPLSAGSLSKLKELSVCCCGKLLCVFPSQFLPMLEELQELTVESCHSLEVALFQLEGLVPSNILPNLQKLCVEGCPNIESVVFKIEKEKEAADDSTLIIPQLWYLRISDMENLKSFYSSSTASNAHSLFNHQVILPDLEVLEVDQLGNIVEIWDKQFPRVSLPNLEVLHVSDLENLERLGLGPLSAGSLSRLKKILVRCCGKLLCVFPSQFLPMLEELQELTVESCHSLVVVFQLEGFVPSNILPNLQKLFVEGCPEIESMVFNLKETAADDSTLIIPRLWYLRISDMENLKSFYSSSTASNAHSLFNHQVAFPKLENLELEGCASLRYTFHPYMGVLANLEEIIIKHCSEMRAVISKEIDKEEEVEDRQQRKTETTMFPNLSKLELHHLQELKLFCHYTRPLEFPLLRQMAICYCPSMDSFSLGHVRALDLSLKGITHKMGKMVKDGDDTTMTAQKNQEDVEPKNGGKKISGRISIEEL